MTISTCPPPQGGSPAGRTAALAGVAVLASLFVAACGGNGDAPAPPPPAPVTQVPASAATSDAALEMFAIGLAQTDAAEPLTLALVPTLPTSETDEPVATP